MKTSHLASVKLINSVLLSVTKCALAPRRRLINKLEHNTDASNSSASHNYGTRSSNNIFHIDFTPLFVSVLIHISIVSIHLTLHSVMTHKTVIWIFTLIYIIISYCFTNQFNVILLLCSSLSSGPFLPGFLLIFPCPIQGHSFIWQILHAISCYLLIVLTENIQPIAHMGKNSGRKLSDRNKDPVYITDPPPIGCRTNIIQREIQIIRLLRLQHSTAFRHPIKVSRIPSQKECTLKIWEGVKCPHTCHRGIYRKRGIALTNHNLDNGWLWVVNFMPQLLYPSAPPQILYP